MSKAEAKDFFDALEAKIPALPAIKRLMNKRAELEKTLRTVYGHKIVYPDLHRDDIPKWRIAKARRQYFNARIQGSQADIIKLCMWASYKLCLKYGASMLIQVHDELVFEVPEANAALFCDALLPVFNNTKLLPGLNTKGTPGIGNNWYEAKEDAENRE
jgi:DNA polymerase-1